MRTVGVSGVKGVRGGCWGLQDELRALKELGTGSVWAGAVREKTAVRAEGYAGVTEQTWGGVNNIQGPPFYSRSPSPILGSPCPPPEERRLSMPEIGEKERNYLFKRYTDLTVMT